MGDHWFKTMEFYEIQKEWELPYEEREKKSITKDINISSSEVNEKSQNEITKANSQKLSIQRLSQPKGSVVH